MQIRLNAATSLSEQEEQSAWYGKDVANSHATSKHVNSAFKCFPGVFGTVF